MGDRPAPGGFSGLWLQVAHGREALALAARNFYNKPDERLALTGITGTNGKTTTSTLIDAMLRATGKTTALIGTIEYHLAGRVLPAVNTTPESLDLFAMFAELESLGGTHVTFEASSHALDLGRIYAMNVHTAGFTNFTRDHLDYHHTLVQQGVPAVRIRTVSYGKEKPFCTEDNDQCWQQNRVDHFAFDR